VVVHAGNAAPADAAVVRPVRLVGPAGRADRVESSIWIVASCSCCITRRRRHRCHWNTPRIREGRLGVRRQRQGYNGAVGGGTHTGQVVAVRQQQDRDHAVRKEHPNCNRHAAADGVLDDQPDGVAGAGAKGAARSGWLVVIVHVVGVVGGAIDIVFLIDVVIVIFVETATNGADATVVGLCCCYILNGCRFLLIAIVVIFIGFGANKHGGYIVRFVVRLITLISVVAPPQGLQRRAGLFQLPRHRTANAPAQQHATRAARLLFSIVMVVGFWMGRRMQKELDIFVVVRRRIIILLLLATERALAPPGHPGR